MEQRAGFSTVEEAIAVLKRGGMIVLVDDADREDEGDLVMLAEHVTPEAINFMITYGRGLVCVPLTAEHARRLRLHLMVEENHNTDPHRTAFTVSIDERTTRTGISAYERAKTIHALVEETTTAEDFRRPGHIFPLIARSGGVLERRGHTEASITLAKLAGAKEVAVICEIVGDDGTMARLETLKRFAKQHALPLLHIAQLVQYEQQRGVHTLQNSLPFKQNRSIFTPDRSQPVFNRSQSELSSYRHSTTDRGTLSDTDTGIFLNSDVGTDSNTAIGTNDVSGAGVEAITGGYSNADVGVDSGTNSVTDPARGAGLSWGNDEWEKREHAALFAELAARIERTAPIPLPTPFGLFTSIVYRDRVNNAEHLALIMGEVSGDEPVLVRLHSECLTGDVFGSKRCDCGPQLHLALHMIAREGKGVMLYMRQEGRGIGLFNKLRAYALQDQGHDTVEANILLGFPDDARDYAAAAYMLHDLGLINIRLMTNNPHKLRELETFGLHIARRVPLVLPPHEHNARYLQTKQEKMGHLLDLLMMKSKS